MKYEIVEVDHERGIKRITTPDSRWYARHIKISEDDKGVWDFVPSVTWIADHFPKGVGFYRWLAGKGWEEAEAIKVAAGDKGGKVHQAIAALLAGQTVAMDDAFENPTTLEPEPLKLDEYECLMSFADWFAETRPEVIACEFTVWNERYHYAGTVDLYCRIKGVPYIIDFKTSPEIWPQFELQLSAYLHADSMFSKGTRLAILQVGYRRNRKRWKFTPVRSQFPLFLATRRIWKRETSSTVPLQRDYPLSLSLSEYLPEKVPMKGMCE